MEGSELGVTDFRGKNDGGRRASRSEAIGLIGISGALLKFHRTGIIVLSLRQAPLNSACSEIGS